jgi:hypothetical protein
MSWKYHKTLDQLPNFHRRTHQGQHSYLIIHVNEGRGGRERGDSVDRELPEEVLRKEILPVLITDFERYGNCFAYFAQNLNEIIPKTLQVVRPTACSTENAC